MVRVPADGELAALEREFDAVADADAAAAEGLSAKAEATRRRGAAVNHFPPAQSSLNWCLTAQSSVLLLCLSMLLANSGPAQGVCRQGGSSG